MVDYVTTILLRMYSGDSGLILLWRKSTGTGCTQLLNLYKKKYGLLRVHIFTESKPMAKLSITTFQENPTTSSSKIFFSILRKDCGLAPTPDCTFMKNHPANFFTIICRRN